MANKKNNKKVTAAGSDRSQGVSLQRAQTAVLQPKKGKGQPNAKKTGAASRAPTAPRAQGQPKRKSKKSKGELATALLWKKIRRRKFKTVDVVFLTQPSPLLKGRRDQFLPAHSYILKNASVVLHQLVEEHENLGKGRKTVTTDEDQQISGIPAGALLIPVPRSKTVLWKVLRYIYTGRVHSGEIPEFLRMAAELGLEEKLEETWRTWKSREQLLTIKNATKIFDISYWKEDKEMLKQSLEFIEENAATVLASRGFSNMSKAAMERVLVSNDLRVCSEMEIFEALIKWLRSHCNKVVNLKAKDVAQKLGTTTHLIRYTKIPLKELLTDVRKSGVLSEDHWVQMMLTREDPNSNPLGLNLKMRRGIGMGRRC